MHIEYEARILDINKEDIIKKLEKIGATKKGEYFQKRYVYDFKPKTKGKFIRLRTNGIDTTLTIKNRSDETKIDGTKELEMKVEDFEKAYLFLKELGYEELAYQENKRITYILEDVTFDIDTYPMIPTYLEIEGKNKEDVLKYIDILDLKMYTIMHGNIKKVYEKYNIDIDEFKRLVFKEEIK